MLDRTLKYDKQWVIEKMQTNLARHHKIVEEANEGYMEAIIDRLQTMLENARKGEIVEPHTGLNKPSDHCDDYHRAIEMLEYCEDEEVLLNSHEFRRYIKDEWDWQNNFLDRNRHYSRTARHFVEERQNW